MEKLVKHGGGLLAKINNSKSIEYKILDKKTISDIFDKVQNTIDNKPLVHNIYVSRLSYIMIYINNRTDNISIEIKKLFRWYNLYTRLLKLSDLKFHHIYVGYSRMSSEYYSKHRQQLINNKDVIENKIIKLWELNKM